MDTSLSNFELSESTVKLGTESENGSDKSEPIEILNYGDVESSSNKHEDCDNNLPSTVTLLRDRETGTKVYLVGTAHFSKESQEDVKKVVQNVQPNLVVVELCTSRTSILELDEKTILEEAKKIDFARVLSTVKSNGVVNGLMYILLLNMSAHITKEIGMAPGGEFRVAYKEASKIPNCYVHLGDRPIGITMRRALTRLTWFQTFKLAWHLLTTKESISVEEVEKYKNRDMLEQLLADLAGEYPAFREVFLDERDIYLTNSLQAAARIKPSAKPGEIIPDEPLKVVGVFGMGHIPGIIRLWNHDQRQYMQDIMTIPPPSLTSKIIRYSFRISLLGLGGYFIYKLIPLPSGFRANFNGLTNKIITSIRFSDTVKYTLN
ncbi:traB domain-containing protein [Sitophilus oryzae]|uniref:TraB domain-containing protein n=1 Tax=Sitophilus oryzae TaxID=7048 RepID=A0A6J2XNX6_SITOR|nr:traB domain-containing protein [Sitophilus oryzae]